MSLAFFTRTRTGALVSRLNTDVGGIQSAFTDILSTVVGNFITVVLMLVAMFALSWQITLISLILVPVFIIPARFIGKKNPGAYARDLRSRVADEQHDGRAIQCRRRTARENFRSARQRRRSAFQALAPAACRTSTSSSRITHGSFSSPSASSPRSPLRSPTAGAACSPSKACSTSARSSRSRLPRALYGPLTALSNVQVDNMTTLVSFDRVFEIFDLKPMVAGKTECRPLPSSGPAKIEFKNVSFRYPTAEEVSLASLESVAVLSKSPEKEVLHDMSFIAEAGQIAALVGPSGAGKTTITQLVPRLYDVARAQYSDQWRRRARRHARLDPRKIGIVTQEAHMFHETHPRQSFVCKTGRDRSRAHAGARAAQILPLVESLPQGIDTLDRRTRLSAFRRRETAPRDRTRAPESAADRHLRRSNRASRFRIRAAIQKAFEERSPAAPRS